MAPSQRKSNNKSELRYNKDFYDVMSNAVIMGKQRMSLQAARLLRLVISNVVFEDKNFITYKVKATDLAAFLGTNKNNVYRDVRIICDELMRSVLYVEGNNPKHPWKMYHWTDTCSYDENGILTIRLSKEVKEFILQLSDNYTQYQIKNILSFGSFYAIRLYEILKFEQSYYDSNEVTIDVEELREILICKDIYPKFADFRKNIIEAPISKDINLKSDIYVIPHYNKVGREIKSITFEIFTNRDPENENSIAYKMLHKGDTENNSP